MNNNQYKFIIKTNYYLKSNNSFILDKLYLKNKINYSLKINNLCIDGYDELTIIYLVYVSYIHDYTNFKQIKSFYNYLFENKINLGIELNQGINLLEFIYLTAFNKLFRKKNLPELYKLILFLQKKIKENSDFILYKIFYKNYFKCKIQKYEIISSFNKDDIIKINKLLGCHFYTLEMYNHLNNNDKKFLLNVFYNTFINSNNIKNYMNIHPIIFNFEMYKNIAKKIGYNTSDGIRIIIGESLNKIGLLIDLYYKSDSYYIPFSNNIYKNDNFIINKIYKKYLTLDYLNSFKFIINKIIPYENMLNAQNIYLYDLISSGRGIFSFLHIFNIIFPEFKNKITLILISDIINKKFKLYFQQNNLKNIKKKLTDDKIKHRMYNFKCNLFILSVFTQEEYNYRCFKYLPIEKINNFLINKVINNKTKKSLHSYINIKIFKNYKNTINRNNLIKFYIIYKFLS